MQSFLDGDFLSRFEHIVYDAEARSRYVEEEKLPKSVHKGVSLFHGHRAGRPELKVTVKVREKKAFASWDTQDAWLRNMNAFLSRRYYSPYVAQVYECLHDEQNYYMVMERVPGPDLWQYLHTVVKVSEDLCRGNFIVPVIYPLSSSQELFAMRWLGVPSIRWPAVDVDRSGSCRSGRTH